MKRTLPQASMLSKQMKNSELLYLCQRMVQVFTPSNSVVAVNTRLINEGNLSIHRSLDEFEKIKRESDGTITESHPLTKDLNFPRDCEREEFVETPN